MKKILLILIILIAVFMTACEKFLDKNPLDQISGPTFWKTQEDAEMGLAGVYQILYSAEYTYNRGDWDCMTDNSHMRWNHQNITNMARGLIEPTGGGMVYGIYASSYAGIARCNNFLANVETMELDAEVKNRMTGEVLFLRAFFYFTLTEFYGGVPLLTNPVTIEEAKVKQASKAEVIAHVLKDLDDAIGKLPDKPYTAHAVKGTALTLKAKVLLHNNRWAEAATVANQVIQSGKFLLYSNYKGIFRSNEQENNPEIIFSTRYLLPDLYAFYGPDIEWGWWGSIQLFQNLVDEFECVDGLPITSSPLYDPSNKRANRDPRLGFTVRFQAEGELVEGIWDPGYGSETGYMPKKYIENINVDYSLKSHQDWVHLRYADVLLMYAEAKNEAEGPDQSVYEALNTVRARVNMPALPVGLSKDEMRQRIRHERRVEFAMEGSRYQDLLRWRIAETIIPSIVDPGGVRRQFDPSKHYLLPFPQQEMDINDKLDQNSGY